MAEVVVAIGLAASIVQFVQITQRVTSRLAEFKRATDSFPGTMEHLCAQLPLLVELVNKIHIDCQQRRRSIDAAVTANRDNHLIGAVEGLRRQVENFERIIIALQPTKNSSFHYLKKTLISFTKEKDVQAIEKRLETYKSLLTLNFSIPIEGRRNSSRSGLTSYNVLPRHVPRFLGREKVLNEIREYHQDLEESAGHRIVALQGMGGQGKTQTALEYCRRFRQAQPQAKIVWIDTSSPASVLRSFDQIYALMFPSQDSQLDQKYKRAVVLQEIAAWECPWLIVYDNFDKPNLFGNVSENFPSGAAGALLFTTRSVQAGERLGHCIKLAGIDIDDGVELFIYRSGCEKEKSTITEAARIVERMGFLPLAIDQAAAYIKARRLRLPDFWEHFDIRRGKVLGHTPVAEWEYRRSSSESENEKSLSAFTTWELSLDEYKDGTTENESIDKFLTLASIFHSSTISEMTFRHMTLKSVEDGSIGLENKWLECFTSDRKWDSFTYQDIIAHCYELSLLQTFNISGTRTTFTFHPLIADWLRLRKSFEVRWRTLQEAASYLASFINQNLDTEQPVGNRYPFDFATSWEILYYIDDVLQEESTFRENDNEKHLSAECLEAFASIYWAMDKFYEARALLSRAVDMHNKDNGEEDPLTLVATDSLGQVQSHLDVLDHAQELLGHVLELRRKSLGSNDPSLLNTQYHLGVIDRRRGDYGPAIETFQTCLAAVEAGEVDPNKAIDWYASLGGALARTSQIVEAESILRKSMGMCATAGVQTGVEYMWPMNWLIRLLCAMNRIDEADTILMATHPQIIEQYGPNSWEACFVNELMGVVAYKRGDLTAAKVILQTCLETYHKKYERFDVDEILGATHTLGEVNWILGNISEAHRLLISAADGYERMCGTGAPTALEPLGALLEVAIVEKDNLTLDQTLTRIELILNQTFDTKALYVLNVKVQMSHAYIFVGKHMIARAHLEAAATGFAEVLGLEHARTREVRAALANMDLSQEL